MFLNKKNLILFFCCVFIFLCTNFASAAIRSCTFRCPLDSPTETAQGEPFTRTSTDGTAYAIEIFSRILTINCGYFPASEELINSWSEYLVDCECAESLSTEDEEVFDREDGVCRFPEGTTATPEGTVPLPSGLPSGLPSTETSEDLPIQGIDVPTPLGTTSIPVLFGRVIKGILGIVGSIALLMFIYGGFLWLLSGGNTEKIAKGKNTLIYATIGLVIIFISYALVNFVINAITNIGA